MATKELFDDISTLTSKMTTLHYSTSFSLGIRFLHPRFREAIFHIYGFVRFADEIVDTFHDFDKEELLRDFIADTAKAVQQRISLNPILNSFQKTVHDYGIPYDLVETFLQSMEMDLHPVEYSPDNYKRYILGSAEVVGLMCLKVFCENNEELYNELRPAAMSLGSAFQKVNFLRDLKEDSVDLGRVYFPGLRIAHFDDSEKSSIQHDIRVDFDSAKKGIHKLPKDARFGVYLAYRYYWALLRMIEKTKAEELMHRRIRIPDWRKILILATSLIRHHSNWL